MSKRGMIFKVITFVLPVAALAAIWLLTVQTPNETMGFSDWRSNLLTSTGLVSVSQASFIMRKVAHTAEFLSVGILAAFCALAWFSDKWTHKKLALDATLLCVACSLADQTHKLFVPSREFDGRGLTCDAVGYLIGITVVFALVGLGRACKTVTKLRRRNEFPFDLSNPNGFSSKTLKAMDDADRGRASGPYKSNEDTWESIFDDEE